MIRYRVDKSRCHHSILCTLHCVTYLFIHSHTAFLVLHQLAKEVNRNKGLGMSQPTRGGCVYSSYLCTRQRDVQSTGPPTVSAHAVTYILTLRTTEVGFGVGGGQP